MYPGKVLKLLAQVVYFMMLLGGSPLPALAQTKSPAEALPMVTQLSGSAGVLLPGKPWQNIQNGQTLLEGSEIVTSLSGLKLSFLQAKIVLSPFCHLIIKKIDPGKKNLMLLVQTGKVELFGDTKQIHLNFLDTSQQAQITQQPRTSSFAQTYRILSPRMGL